MLRFHNSTMQSPGQPGKSFPAVKIFDRQTQLLKNAISPIVVQQFIATINLPPNDSIAYDMVNLNDANKWF